MSILVNISNINKNIWILTCTLWEGPYSVWSQNMFKLKDKRNEKITESIVGLNID